MNKLLRIFISLLLILGIITALLFLFNVFPIRVSHAQEQKSIVLWMPPFASSEDGTLDHEFWSHQLKPWAEENNVDLKIEITPWANYEEKYLTAFTVGQGPDIGYMYLEMFDHFITSNSLADISQYFTQEEIDNYNYWDKGNFKGGQYGLPFIVGNPRILYFNMDILKKAGIEQLPTTWEELSNCLVTIKEKTQGEDIIPFAGEWGEASIGALNNLFYPYLWQAGGELYNSDGSQIALLDNNAALKAAEFIRSLKFDKQVLPDECISMTGDDIKSLFGSGKIAVASMSAGTNKYLDEKGINWDFVASLKDEKKAVWVASDSLILNQDSQNKELAASLLKYITSSKVMEQFHTQMQPFPPITKDAAYLDNPKFKSIYEDTDSLHTLYVAPNAFSVMDTLFKNLQLMMIGEYTPEQAIQETVDYANTLK